jgi:hypothetical protein
MTDEPVYQKLQAVLEDMVLGTHLEIVMYERR